MKHILIAIVALVAHDVKLVLNADVGDPLILTPYLKQGKIEEAQEAALVQNCNFFNVTSYAGYFTVDEQFNSSLWFWFFPSENNVQEDPVMLWLNGGPGSSSLYGTFAENGPFIVDENGTVSLREYSWTKNQSVIYMDNPAGTGFSFTNGGLAENETKVGEGLYSALTQFFQLFPELQNNSFFVSGESYAGKYVPAIGYTILKNNPTAELKINLKGILIGNGWTDPIHQLNYGPFLYETGLVSAKIRDQLNAQREETIEAINQEDWSNATFDFLNKTVYRIIDITDVNIYNYIEAYDDIDNWNNFVTSDEIRKALHVGSTEFGDKGVSAALNDDRTKSVAPWLEELLENYRVLIYIGHLDIVCGYPMMLDYLNALNFTGAGDYQESERNIWYVDGEAAGYFRTGDNLVEMMVRNAGHMVPRDQPKWAFEMMYRFVRNETF